MKYLLTSLPLSFYAVLFFMDFTNFCVRQTTVVENGSEVTYAEIMVFCDGVQSVISVLMILVPLVVSIYFTMKTKDIKIFKYFLVAWILIAIFEYFRVDDYEVFIPLFISFIIGVSLLLHLLALFIEKKVSKKTL